MSNEELWENIELYQDRIETITEHIEDAEDSNVRGVLETQRMKYHNAIALLKSEINGRKVVKSDSKVIVDSELNIDVTEIFDQLKLAILEKLEKDFFADNDRRFIKNVADLKSLLSDLKLNARRYHRYYIIDENILKIVPDTILVQNGFYLNKIEVIQSTGSALLINSKSKHFNDAESYHFGNCESEHFDNATSFHMDNCISKHNNNCRSHHFGNSKWHCSENAHASHHDAIS